MCIGPQINEILPVENVCSHECISLCHPFLPTCINQIYNWLFLAQEHALDRLLCVCSQQIPFSLICACVRQIVPAAGPRAVSPPTTTQVYAFTSSSSSCSSCTASATVPAYSKAAAGASPNPRCAPPADGSWGSAGQGEDRINPTLSLLASGLATDGGLALTSLFVSAVLNRPSAPALSTLLLMSPEPDSTPSATENTAAAAATAESGLNGAGNNTARSAHCAMENSLDLLFNHRAASPEDVFVSIQDIYAIDPRWQRSMISEIVLNAAVASDGHGHGRCDRPCGPNMASNTVCGHSTVNTSHAKSEIGLGSAHLLQLVAALLCCIPRLQQELNPASMLRRSTDVEASNGEPVRKVSGQGGGKLFPPSPSRNGNNSAPHTQQPMQHEHEHEQLQQRMLVEQLGSELDRRGKKVLLTVLLLLLEYTLAQIHDALMMSLQHVHELDLQEYERERCAQKSDQQRPMQREKQGVRESLHTIVTFLEKITSCWVFWVDVEKQKVTDATASNMVSSSARDDAPLSASHFPYSFQAHHSASAFDDVSVTAITAAELRVRVTHLMNTMCTGLQRCATEERDCSIAIAIMQPLCTLIRCFSASAPIPSTLHITAQTSSDCAPPVSSSQNVPFQQGQSYEHVCGASTRVARIAWKMLAGVFTEATDFGAHLRPSVSREREQQQQGRKHYGSGRDGATTQSETTGPDASSSSSPLSPPLFSSLQQLPGTDELWPHLSRSVSSCGVFYDAVMQEVAQACTGAHHGDLFASSLDLSSSSMSSTTFTLFKRCFQPSYTARTNTAEAAAAAGTDADADGGVRKGAVLSNLSRVSFQQLWLFWWGSEQMEDRVCGVVLLLQEVFKLSKMLSLTSAATYAAQQQERDDEDNDDDDFIHKTSPKMMKMQGKGPRQGRARAGGGVSGGSNDRGSNQGESESETSSSNPGDGGGEHQGKSPRKRQRSSPRLAVLPRRSYVPEGDGKDHGLHGGRSSSSSHHYDGTKSGEVALVEEGYSCESTASSASSASSDDSGTSDSEEVVEGAQGKLGPVQAGRKRRSRAAGLLGAPNMREGKLCASTSTSSHTQRGPRMRVSLRAHACRRVAAMSPLFGHLTDSSIDHHFGLGISLFPALFLLSRPNPNASHEASQFCKGGSSGISGAGVASRIYPTNTSGTMGTSTTSRGAFRPGTNYRSTAHKMQPALQDRDVGPYAPFMEVCMAFLWALDRVEQAVVGGDSEQLLWLFVKNAALLARSMKAVLEAIDTAVTKASYWRSKQRIPPPSSISDPADPAMMGCTFAKDVPEAGPTSTSDGAMNSPNEHPASVSGALDFRHQHIIPPGEMDAAVALPIEGVEIEQGRSAVRTPPSGMSNSSAAAIAAVVAMDLGALSYFEHMLQWALTVVLGVARVAECFNSNVVRHKTFKLPQVSIQRSFLAVEQAAEKLAGRLFHRATELSLQDSLAAVELPFSSRAPPSCQNLGNLKLTLHVRDFLAAQGRDLSASLDFSGCWSPLSATSHRNGRQHDLEQYRSRDGNGDQSRYSFDKYCRNDDDDHGGSGGDDDHYYYEGNESDASSVGGFVALTSRNQRIRPSAAANDNSGGGGRDESVAQSSSIGAEQTRDALVDESDYVASDGGWGLYDDNSDDGDDTGDAEHRDGYLSI